MGGQEAANQSTDFLRLQGKFEEQKSVVEADVKARFSQSCLLAG